MTTGLPPQPLDASPEQLQRVEQQDNEKKTLPKGVVLGPDGKPCRSCTSVSSWMAMARSAPASNKDSKPSATQTTTAPSAANASFSSMPSDCPPDVEQLGRSTWTFLHALTAAYPERPSLAQQGETKTFITLFGKMYPCWSCAGDFRSWMKDGNEPRVSNRDDFGRWMCEAHNAVNEKLGKSSFDCNKWEERWRTGWKDGRCG